MGIISVARTHPNILHKDSALLVVVDMQEPFLRNIHEKERVIRNVRALARGASILEVPLIATTQYATHMGGIVPEIAAALPAGQASLDKVCFSCYADDAFAAEVQRSGRRQILLCGIEAHICVSQTAHGLLAGGFQVHVATDAISARSRENAQVGFAKMRQAGAVTSSVETALYELMHAAGTPEFREMLPFIKDLDKQARDAPA